jgi:selenocysteine-specific elongation factor
MRVVGTAGHVDHGKSTLVKALTGINPDRLREEQERQMTIDLGFAWLTLPDGNAVGIVDVPGHRDFIENMLAGVGSIDAAIFVIAADEGVMPQSREHLAILDLLQIDSGVVVLTKTDLVKDVEWLELVREDVRTLLGGSTLEEAPILNVSAQTGEGIPELVDAIQAVLDVAPERKDLGQPRLSIDRAFTISGFGTIVTGTLVDGCLEPGDEIELLPRGLSGRIRGLQTHKEKIERAVPGSRVAVNISGIDVDEIRRGDVLVHPGTATSTRRIDVQFELLKLNELAVKHDQRVKLFVGAAQRVARVRLLGKDVLKPGEQGWLQLELDEPIVTARGDRYILRRPSPPATLGGGQVVDAHPERRHKRMDSAIIERLEEYLLGNPQDMLIQTLRRLGPSDWDAIRDKAGIDEANLRSALEQAINSGAVLKLKGRSDQTQIYVDRDSWKRLSENIEGELEKYHVQNKLRFGMSVEALRSRLQLEPRIASALFQQAELEGLIETRSELIRRAGFRPQLSDTQHRLVDELIREFKNDPFSTPSVKESIAAVGEDVFHYLRSEGELVQVSEDVVFGNEGYSKLVRAVKDMIKEEGPVTIAQIRDRLNTSRKYVLALMEHLDAEGVTERIGDSRRLTHTSD